jgi:hypothetical protein
VEDAEGNDGTVVEVLRHWPPDREADGTPRTHLWRFGYESRTLLSHMAPAPISTSRNRLGIRRVVALALFALQGAVALSPVVERGQSERPQTHVEERGAVHPFAHNDATCALCSVRSMHAAVAARPSGLVAAPRQHGLMTLVALVAPTPDGGPSNLSRAPPSFG